MAEQLSGSSHILIFPLPIQGAVNSMLKLAELILIASHGQILITFVTTEHVHRSLIHHAKAATRFKAYPGFSFLSFPDGLPEDHPRGSDKFMEMVDAVEAASHPLLRKMLLGNSSEGKPFTCMISDGLYSFCLDVANEAQIPVIYFDTISPSCLWVYLCLPHLIQAGEVPFQEDEDLDKLVSVPGMENLLRRRDLPDFCRANRPGSNILMQSVLRQGKQFRNGSGIILNTFEELDASFLSHIRSEFPSCWSTPSTLKGKNFTITKDHIINNSTRL